jgi:hypothetical protein
MASEATIPQAIRHPRVKIQLQTIRPLVRGRRAGKQERAKLVRISEAARKALARKAGDT